MNRRFATGEHSVNGGVGQRGPVSLGGPIFAAARSPKCQTWDAHPAPRAGGTQARVLVGGMHERGTMGKVAASKKAGGKKGNGTKGRKTAPAPDRRATKLQADLDKALRREAKAASRLEAAQAEVIALRAALARIVGPPAPPAPIAEELPTPAAKEPSAPVARRAARPARSTPAEKPGVPAPKAAAAKPAPTRKPAAPRRAASAAPAPPASPAESSTGSPAPRPRRVPRRAARPGAEG